ncbi:MAG TPA: diguanylate cyclase [Actinomycetales bacterium]|nr:diguanylate cyclase [Actinomycetales bacterium]
MSEQDVGVRWPTIRRLYDLTASLNRQQSLPETLQAVVDGVVAGCGFGVAVVNILNDDGDFHTVAVAGPDEVRDMLLGRRNPPSMFVDEFAVAEEWGALRFVPYDRIDPESVVGWVPDTEVSDDPDAWHPLNALYAPLEAPSGELVGMLSVDLPDDGRRPGRIQRELLEMFAAQAGIAVNNARLSEQLRREHGRLKASESLFRLAFDNAGTPMAMISLQEPDVGRYLRVNGALASMLGYPQHELLRRRVDDVSAPEELAGDHEVVARIAAGEGRIERAQKRLLRADGEEVWTSVTSSVVRDDEGAALYLISQYVDITATRRDTERLRRETRTDVLTGLGNRAALEDRLGRELVAGETAVLFCDLDGFKSVNDSLGHHVGDGTLVAVAQRIAACVREEDLVVRLGGDEFVVVADNLASDTLVELADRIRTSVGHPVHIEGQRVSITVSIGVVVAGADEEPQSVVRRADAVMYAVKRAGKNGFRVDDLDEGDDLVG